MKLTTRTPTLPVFRREMDRLFDRMFETPLWPLTSPRLETMWEPMLDFSETNKEFVVRLEVPGISRDDLDVKLDGNLLTLSGKRELHRTEKGEDFIWEEREEGKFMRTLRLPAAVQEGKIEALYTDGVLTVKLPKAEPAAKTRIAIK